MARLPQPRLWAAWTGCLFLFTGHTAVAREFSFEEIAPGVYVGSSPHSEADYQELRGLGIKTVVDMRQSMPRRRDREARTTAARGMAVQWVPMGFHPACDASPEAVLQIMTDSSQQPVFVHCALGRDRTALIAALYRVRYLGWTREAAYAAMQSNRFNPRLVDLDQYFWTYAVQPLQ